jgi:hypothetical protein
LGAGGVEADADQPGAEGFGAAQAVEREQGGDDGVLGGVERGVGAHEAAAAAHQRRVVAGHQRGEGVAVAAAGAADELGVGDGHLRR